MSRLFRALSEAGALTLLSVRALRVLLTRPFELRLGLLQMERIGLGSFGVAGITTLFTGMVLALQTAFSLPGLGVKYYIGTVVGKSLTRELGPVLTALIVGGRVGAGIAAEIGSMKVTEQIDALRSMAADPVRKLVAPRLAACLLMIPVLTLYGDLLGIFGGMLVAVTQLDLEAAFYLTDVMDSLRIADVASGLGKSFVFAYFIAIVACHRGLTVQGGADGVGRATTETVVTTSILVLISDFFLTKLFYVLG
ncbi:MAG: ABC transporter permease [Holophagales bacterium]|nr:MAG: ABC transporter permease [Holophagales bacterium]